VFPLEPLQLLTVLGAGMREDERTEFGRGLAAAPEDGAPAAGQALDQADANLAAGLSSVVKMPDQKRFS
jgi:hypothetical protein